MPTRRDLNFGMLAALAAPLVRAAPAGAQVQGVQMLSGDIAGGFADLVEAAVPPGRGGMIAAVVQQGRLVDSVARGNATIEMGVGIGLDTSFHIASCSKHVVAMALGLLIDQGVIGLDDPVRRYLPDLPDYGIPITVGQIIHHTSGLREQWTLTSLAGFREGDNILQDDVIDLIYRQRAINTPPGAAYAYSNSGYSLQAALVEKLSGMSLREFSRRFMFEPLGMT
ncbi:MAG: serine hydrolase domain-containing protein, partial [Ferrovibrionaceae bacterium]